MNNNKKSPWIVAMALVLVLMTLLAGCKDRSEGPVETAATAATQPVETESAAATNAGAETTEPPAETTEPGEEVTTPPTDQREPAETTIQTPYGTLNFPQEWARFLRVETKEGTDYAVEFYAEFDSGKSQKLFTIRFGGSAENAVGMVNVNGTEVAVHVDSVEFKPGADWSDRDVNVVFSMQEGLNDILADLKLIPPQQEPEAEPILPEDNGTDMAIDTPYGVLYYPSRWKEYLTLETEQKNGYSVSFYSEISGHEAQCLFVVYFGSEQGIEVGAIRDDSGRSVRISVEIISFEPDGSWTDADKTIVYAMQEDMNYLLSKLN